MEEVVRTALNEAGNYSKLHVKCQVKVAAVFRNYNDKKNERITMQLSICISRDFLFIRLS
eukprot:m.167426 g.167426  ORF g.167426 m.167426 type:complete len:60 (+) comp38930_c1_seq1:1116-1295(+)